MWILESLLGDHVNRTATSFYFFDESMVTQTGRRRMVIDIITYHRLGMLIPLGFVLIAVGILCIGLQVQKISTDRAIAVFEAVFHLCHLRPDL